MLACIALALVISTASSAAADDAASSSRLHWSPRWTRFTTLQYGLSAALIGGNLASDAWLESPAQPRWHGPLLLDTESESLFAAGSESGRRRASTVSDAMVLGLALYPFAIDTLLVAGAIDQNFDVAWQMGMISLQSVLLADLITGLTKRLAGRARPDYERCRSGDELACGSRTESFISGHTSTAFVGAGLICAHHQNLRLYGSATAAAVTCGISLATATAVGTLRMVADRHHLSDVLAGAAVGLSAGYLLPNLLNYDFGASAVDPGAALLPLVNHGTLGLTYAGRF